MEYIDVNAHNYGASEYFGTPGTLTPLALGTYPNAQIANAGESLTLTVAGQAPIALHPVTITCD